MRYDKGGIQFENFKPHPPHHSVFEENEFFQESATYKNNEWHNLRLSIC